MLSLVVSLSLISSAFAQMLMINTPPSLIECQPAAIVYSGGQAPCQLRA